MVSWQDVRERLRLFTCAGWSFEKLQHVFPELLRVLKQEAVTGIRIENELCGWLALLHDVGVVGMRHDIVDAIGDQRWRLDFMETTVGGVLPRAPCADRGSLALNGLERDRCT